jgi:hypothetical protein
MSHMLIENEAHGQIHAAKLYQRAIREHQVMLPILVQPEN